MTKPNRLIPAFTRAQEKLLRKHGTPAEFAQDTYAAVPSLISMNEARAAVDAYCAEWEEAARIKPRRTGGGK